MKRILSVWLFIGVAVAQDSGKALLVENGFESGKLDSFTFAVDGKSNPKPVIVDAPVRNGKHAVKFEVVRAPDDKPVQFRCEMVARKNGTRKNYLYQDIGKEYWYGFSVFIPKDWVLDNEPEIIGQWHGVPDEGEEWKNPCLAIRVHNDEYKLERHWDSKRISWGKGRKKPENAYDGEEHPSLGSIKPDLGKWVDWVVHVKWSYKPGDGFTSIWKNGKKVFDKKGPNCFNDKTGPFFRFGLYKWPWRYPRTKRPSKAERHVVYYDEIRIGDASANYELVAPRSK